MDLFTIGYEKAAQADVIAALKRAGVRTLIDVRDRPLSRRAGFSKTALAASLEAAGIAYVHLKGLGTPKEGRLANQRGDMPEFWRIVDEALRRPEAAHDLARAGRIAQEAPVCLLCLEADPHQCHRNRVAELMRRDYGLSIRHLSPGSLF